MNKNHSLLQELEVSSPELDRLVKAARKAGALGAKLSGGGLGGNIIAMVDEGVDQVIEALKSEGAVNTIISPISAS
jgi:mevalonate kinase